MNDLLLKIKKDDKDAFYVFYKKNKTKFLRNLKRKYGNLMVNDLEAIYHETLIIFRNQLINSNLDVKNPIAYINTIGFRIAAKSVKSQKKLVGIEELIERQGDENTIDNQYELSHQERYLNELMDELKEDDKQLLIDYFRHGHDIKTIAKSLGLSPNTCIKRKTRILEKLRKAILDKKMFD